MESLQDKITDLKKKVEDNDVALVAAKEEYDAKTASIKDENKTLNKVIKKLEDTQASIDSIYASVIKPE